MVGCDIIVCTSLQRLHELYMSDSWLSVPVQRGYGGNQFREVASKPHLEEVGQSTEVPRISHERQLN